MGLTLDTAHLMIGGTDPIEIINDAIGRIEYVHLKDADLNLARPVMAGDQSLLNGVRSGMFANLGQGDIPIDEVVVALERAGYGGWYVLEQDVAITDELPEEGSGPMLGVRSCIEYLRKVDSRFAASITSNGQISPSPDANPPHATSHHHPGPASA